MKGYNFKMKRIIILKQNGENIKSLIRIISSKLDEITDFPGVIDEDDIFEEDDFDLDNDLQPVKEREYVSLKRDENL